jgi:ABC-2 type transport system ATP-binding protein
VSKLCPRIAILLAGRVVAQGEITALVASLSGRIWRKSAQRAELDAIRREFRVLSTRYADGHLIVHVLSDGAPEAGFEPVGGDLQDVYFTMTAEGEHAVR